MRFTNSLYLAIAASLVQGQTNGTAADAAKRIVSHIDLIYSNTSEPVPGLFSDEYYFWEAGLAWDSLINYWAYTGDDAHVETIQRALVHQTGSDNNFMPANQTRSLGNDDQSFWALAAMSAAELGLPTPSDFNLTWFDLAKNTFDTQVARWEDHSCAGGLRWQIFTFNAGYDYKNAISQANFAQLGARLYRFTGNGTYLEWAERAVEWSTNVGLISSARDSTPAIYDGTSTTANCSDINHLQWTINAGQFMSAYAYACNGTDTCSDAWKELGRVSLATTSGVFASNDSILTEVACASANTCNVDQLAYRAPLSRALANARDMASDIDASSKKEIGAIVAASSAGAQGQCTTVDGIYLCGSDWSASTWDGTSGLGQDLSALEIVLATYTRKPLRMLNGTGGGFSGNGTAGGANGGPVDGPAQSEGDANGAAGLAYSMLFVAVPGVVVALVNMM